MPWLNRGTSARSSAMLTRDRDGSLWIATNGGGLVRWRDGKFSTLASNLFAASDLRSLLEDDEGSLWIGSHGAGLLRLRDGKFASAGEPEGLQGNLAWTIAAAQQRRPVGRIERRAQHLRRRPVSGMLPDRAATKTSRCVRCSRTGESACGSARRAPVPIDSTSTA